MKKLLLIVAVLVGVAFYTANRVANYLFIDDLVQANVEALTAGEGGIDVSCFGIGRIFCPLTLMQDSSSVTYSEV